MKKLVTSMVVLAATFPAVSQTNDETAVKDISAKIFRWEAEGLRDSLKGVFHDKLQVWGTTGGPVSKSDYLERLSSPNFIHNNVSIEKSTALVADNTAIVQGEGIFGLTISGNKTRLHLSYTEVFTRLNPGTQWMLLAITAKPKTE